MELNLRVDAFFLLLISSVDGFILAAQSILTDTRSKEDAKPRDCFHSSGLGEALKLGVKSWQSDGSWVQVPAWLLPSCVTLGKPLNVCEIQFLGMRRILTP